MAGILPQNGVPPGQTAGGLSSPTLTPGCQNVWYAQVCTPRLDPVAQNTLLAEVINAVNCQGMAYNCERNDNLCQAMNRIFDNSIVDCIRPTFPDASGACVIEQLVLITDSAGCRRIARYSRDSVILATATNASVVGTAFPQENRPFFPGNPATFYTLAALGADQAAGTIDNAKLVNNQLANFTFTLTCPARVEFTQSSTVVFNPATNGGNGAQSRIVLRINNQFQLDANNIPDAFASFTNYESGSTSVLSKVLAVGTYFCQLYIVAEGTSMPPVQVPFVGSPTSTGTTFSAVIAQS